MSNLPQKVGELIGTVLGASISLALGLLVIAVVVRVGFFNSRCLNDQCS